MTELCAISFPVFSALVVLEGEAVVVNPAAVLIHFYFVCACRMIVVNLEAEMTADVLIEIAHARAGFRSGLVVGLHEPVLH